MIKKIIRSLQPNPFDCALKRAKRKKLKSFLFAWNRGLGDIALGLYGLIHKTKQMIPDSKITFLIRENLKDGFQLLSDIEVIIAPDWQRGKPYDVEQTLLNLQIDPSSFDMIIPWPDPTYWGAPLRGKLIPCLQWQEKWDKLCNKFSLPQNTFFVGVQPIAETNYGLWRNWPQKRWNKFFTALEKRQNIKVLLFGFEKKPIFHHKNIIDLRGKTSLFEMLSIIKNSCNFMLLPDSGILSMTYYLNIKFPIEVMSLWAHPDHGIMKQNVPSPNKGLVHTPFIAEDNDLKNISSEKIVKFILNKLDKGVVQCKLF